MELFSQEVLSANPIRDILYPPPVTQLVGNE
jgi:hypothetical protein